MDAVAAHGDVLRVQRLVDVADKVDDELGGLAATPGVEVAVQQLLRVVLDRADDAAVLLAVALKVDAAVRRRRVLGVDEVEVLGEATPSRVPDAVGPRGDAGEIVLRVVAQEVLEVSSSLVLDKIAGEIGDGDVTQACGTLISLSEPLRRHGVRRHLIRKVGLLLRVSGDNTYCPKLQRSVKAG